MTPPTPKHEVSTVAPSPVNIPLLKQVLDKIEERPDLLEQAYWRRELPGGDIAYDVGGWAAVLSGAAFLPLPNGEVSEAWVIPAGGGDPEFVWDYATRMLGIEHTVPPATAYPPLFSPLNTLADIRQIAEELIKTGDAE